MNKALQHFTQEIYDIFMMDSRKIQVYLAFFVLTIVTRIPLHSEYLYEWDSVHYALAIEKFDIAQYHPHPPGNPLFVLTAKLFNIIFNDANKAIVFMNIGLSALTIVLVHSIAKNMFNNVVGIISSVVLLFNPIFWFYGEIASAYASEAFAAALIAYTSYKLIQGDTKIHYLYISTFVFGLMCGVRLNIILFLFPLWIFCVVMYRNEKFGIFIALSRMLKVLPYFIFAVFIWFIPMILKTGGISKYLELSKEIFFRASRETSILFGADVNTYYSMLINFIKWNMTGAWVVLFLFPLYFFVNSDRRSLLERVTEKRGLFIALWMLPALIFHILIHIPKAGYIMTYLPAISIVTGYLLNFAAKQITPNNKSVTLILFAVIYISINTYCFATAKDVSIKAIQNRDKINSIYIKNIEKVVDYDPDSSIVITVGVGKPSWRHLMYYVPQTDTIYYLPWRDSIFLGRDHTSSKIVDKVYCTSRNIKRIIWNIGDEERGILFPQIIERAGLKEVTKKTSFIQDDIEHSLYVTNIPDSISGDVFDFMLFRIEMSQKVSCSASLKAGGP